MRCVWRLKARGLIRKPRNHGSVRPQLLMINWATIKRNLSS